jgi:hypothetical protein
LVFRKVLVLARPRRHAADRVDRANVMTKRSSTMGRMIRPATAVVLALLLAGCAGRARSPVLDVQTGPGAADRLAAAFTAAGFYTHVLDETSLVLARIEKTEVNVVVFVEDDGASLQALLTCPWRTQPGDPERVAAWNASHRFSHAFLDEERQPTLGADFALHGTTTAAAVGAWGKMVLDLADAFVAEVWPAR